MILQTKRTVCVCILICGFDNKYQLVPYTALLLWFRRLVARTFTTEDCVRSLPVQLTWDLWITKWHWESFFSPELRLTLDNVIPIIPVAHWDVRLISLRVPPWLCSFCVVQVDGRSLVQGSPVGCVCD